MTALESVGPMGLKYQKIKEDDNFYIRMLDYTGMQSYNDIVIQSCHVSIRQVAQFMGKEIFSVSSTVNSYL